MPFFHEAMCGLVQGADLSAPFKTILSWLGWTKKCRRGSLVGGFSAGDIFKMNNDVPSVPAANLLVVGYGNSLRRDDGVGPRVAELVETLRLPGVQTLICQQLSPEHADTVARSGRVVFVDAAVDDLTKVKFRKLVPGDTSQLMAHAADPRTILALARDVFGRTPEAWWLTIPAVNLGFGADFSPAAESGIQAALAEIKGLALGSCCTQNKIGEGDDKICDAGT